MGSRAFTGVARAVWHLTRDVANKSRRLLLPGKNNLAAEGYGLAFTIQSPDGGPAAICWESDPVAMNADEAMAEAAEGGSTALGDAVAWLESALADGPVASTEIYDHAEAEGIARKTLNRAKRQLGVHSCKEGQRDDALWFWVLPKANATTPSQESREVPEAAAATPGGP